MALSDPENTPLLPSFETKYFLRSVRTIIGFSVAWLMMGCVDQIPQALITPMRLSATQERIEEFYRDHEHLPASLDDLPIVEKRENSILDVWGRPLIYAVQARDSFTLTSLGKDGAPGGEGNNADTIKKYRVVMRRIQEVSNG